MKIKPKPELGQNFLVNEKVLQNLIKIANLGKNDIILEIGPGTGIITKELAKKVKQVIAIEIDKRFLPALKFDNVSIIIADAFKLLNRKGKLSKWARFKTSTLNELTFNDFKINKIVAALPYQTCEPLMHNLLFKFDFELAALIVPIKFAKFMRELVMARAQIEVELIAEVPKSAFSPVPNTKSAIVLIKPKKLAIAKEKGLYVAKCLYLLEAMKLKNALREALISLYAKFGRKLTKKQAKELIKSLGIPDQGALVHDITEKKYKEIVAKINDIKL